MSRSAERVNLSKRKALAACFVAVVSLIVAAVPAFSQSLWQASGDSGYTGYWKLVSTEVETLDDYEDGPYEHTFTASELEHTHVMKGEYSEGGKTTTEVAAFLATCTAPPQIVQADEDIVLALTLELTENTDEHFHFRQDSYVKGPYGRFDATTEDGEDSCDVWAIGDWGNDPTRKTTAEVCGKLGSAYQAGETESISWRSCDGITTWTYEWVDSSTPIVGNTDEEWEDYYDPVTGQKIETDASDTPGAQSNAIDSNVVEKHDPTEGGAYIAIAAGIVVVGGVAYTLYKRKRNASAGAGANAGAGEKKEDKKQKATYQMTIYKSFGNELRAGGAARAVGARIEKHSAGPNGATKVEILDAETQKIVMRGAQNLVVHDAGMWNRYRAANISVPKAATGTSAQGEQPILELTYTGKGGTLVERVKFKLAGEPVLVHVEEPAGTVPATWDPCLEAIISDAEGITFYIGAQNFTEKPGLPEFSASDASIQADFEPYDDPRLPDLHIFKARLSNAIKLESPYGQWPLEHKLNITVKNNYGEEAGMSIRLRLWPEGISFDTRKLKSGRARKDSVLVDTGDILKSETVDYNIEGAVMEVAVAYKDEQGRVVVTRPEEPSENAYLRLTGKDDATERILNPDTGSSNSRVWYTLTYLHKPSYTKDGRLGTLKLTPLMPMVSQQAGAEFSGYFELSYTKDACHYDGKATFDIKGLSAGAYEESREKLIKDIYRLLQAFRLDNWERVDRVLASFGAAAEREQQRLGTAEQRKAADRSSMQLYKAITQIQSVQRLNAMKKMIYEAADVTLTHEYAEAKSEADLHNALYVSASCARWANDIAFECWLRAVIKNKDASDAAVWAVTPLKKYVEGYLEILGQRIFDSDVDASLKNYFTWQSAYESLFCEYVESEIINLVTIALSGGVVAVAKDKRTYAMLGGIGAFLFLKHVPSNWKYDETTGRSEFDLWATLKDTMNDFTSSSIKIVLSLLLAWILKRLNAGGTSGTASSNLSRYDALTGIFGWFMNSTFSESVVNQFMDDAGKQETIWSAVLGSDFVGDAIDDHVAKPVANGVGSAFGGFGKVTLRAVSDEGNTYDIEVSLLTATMIFVNHLFAQCGLDFELNVSTTLPDHPDYREHDALVKGLKEVEAAKEIDFLIDPPRAIEWSDPDPSVFAAGAEAPTFDTGTDWHRYAK